MLVNVRGSFAPRETIGVSVGTLGVIGIIALRVYPGRADSLGVSLLAQGQDAVLEKLDAWQMKNIYPPKEDVTDK